MQSLLVFALVLGVASAGVVVSHAPVIAGATSSQYHAQDELGQYSYGYAGGPSSKAESKDAFGNVRGSYSYIDGSGLTQTVNYVANDNGFHVAGTNLPVGPAPAPVVAAVQPAAVVAKAPAAVTYAAAPAVTYAAAPAIHHVAAAPAVHHVAAHHVAPVHVAAHPLPPADTPEVAAAKVQHAQAHAEALARSG